MLGLVFDAHYIQGVIFILYAMFISMYKCTWLAANQYRKKVDLCILLHFWRSEDRSPFHVEEILFALFLCFFGIANSE